MPIFDFNYLLLKPSPSKINRIPTFLLQNPAARAGPWLSYTKPEETIQASDAKFFESARQERAHNSVHAEERPSFDFDERLPEVQALLAYVTYGGRGHGFHRTDGRSTGRTPETETDEAVYDKSRRQRGEMGTGWR